MSPIKISQGGAERQPGRPPGRGADFRKQIGEMAAQPPADPSPAVSEFRSLNPEHDATARLRNLINEEGSDLRSFDLDRLPVGHRLQNDPEQSLPERSPYATRSEEASRRYIFDNFESNDRLAVMVRNQATNHTLQRIARAETIASPEFQAWLRYKNASGFDIYLSLNILKPHAHGRTKADIHKIRHLYLDLDQQAPQKLGTIYQSAAIPLPNYVLETSPNKYQVIWRVEGITQNRAEQLLRGLAQRFGGDPAATDAARVFRLPGFNNKKYSQDFTVKVERTNLPEAVYHESDFKVETSRREPVLNAGDGRVEKRDLSLGSGKTQSERDWAYVIGRLREGVAPQDIVQDLASFRASDRFDPLDSAKRIASRKSNPIYYAERTVGRAMEYLGKTAGPAHQSSDQEDRDSPETELSR